MSEQPPIEQEPVTPEPPKVEPPKIEEPTEILSPSPNPIVERYASKLKAEMGESYSTKFDAMSVEIRIAAMEATLDVINKKVEPLAKPDINIPLGEQPPVDNKRKSFLKQWEAEGYSNKFRGNRGLTKKLYGN